MIQPRSLVSLVLVGAALTTPATAQSSAAGQLPPRANAAPQHEDPALAFLAPYGLENFPRQSVRALQVFLDAEDKMRAGHYAAAKAVLDDLWAEYPPGDLSWGSLPTQPFGINIGSPPCYYGLRMLSDMAEWRVNGTRPAPGLEPRTARLTVIVVGESNGIEPRNQQELVDGTGVQVTHQIDPRIEENDYRVVHQSLALFNDYVFAATGGLLTVETQILPLPDVNLDVHATAQPSYAGLVDASDVWPHVPEVDIAATDWWWILYPSHVPEQYPAFQGPRVHHRRHGDRPRLAVAVLHHRRPLARAETAAPRRRRLLAHRASGLSAAVAAARVLPPPVPTRTRSSASRSRRTSGSTWVPGRPISSGATRRTTTTSR